MGVPDHIGYDFTVRARPLRAPHDPDEQRRQRSSTGSSRAEPSATAIAIKPPKSGFDLNYQAAIDWTTPTLQ